MTLSVSCTSTLDWSFKLYHMQTFSVLKKKCQYKNSYKIMKICFSSCGPLSFIERSLWSGVELTLVLHQERPKVLCISRVVSYLYETDFEIWAGFGLVMGCNFAKECVSKLQTISHVFIVLRTLFPAHPIFAHEICKKDLSKHNLSPNPKPAQISKSVS